MVCVFFTHICGENGRANCSENNPEISLGTSPPHETTEDLLQAVIWFAS